MTGFSDTELMRMNHNTMQVRCPCCGYKMPIVYDADAECRGVHIVCKGRSCKHIFEVRITQGKQQIR